ncbi:TetR/AcrR family transcriptional regulator [Nocardia pseudobrasiliensis]|uniref:TetR family transcriptional regulator n=1 Tax=Nocardia pseudobrasiliensis TaxID=45979 RepID=A0A370I8Q4_9NOCA|nr:TetR/AcrR family transcriptional regulator [Nocardia pseudobrasiliensis]RDI67068.1 TetR family transcriptional regulator [Nocardia pseudobrasiliensis]
MAAEGRARGRPRTGVREAVIESAQRLLTESGVARLSTREVAARAGVAESSIFYHFGDRMGLLDAVIQHHLRPLKDMLADRPGRAAELRDDLLALIATLEEFFLVAIPVMAAILSDAELRATYSARSRDLDLGPHRAVEAVLTQLGPDRETLRPAALLLVGAAHQRALQRHLSPPAALSALPSAEAIAEAALPLFTTEPR